MRGRRQRCSHCRLLGLIRAMRAGVANPDVGGSPYAGLQVALTVTARNLAGVSSTTVPVVLTLPPPDLQDKTALALAALRQRLALHPKDTQGAGNALRATGGVSSQPDFRQRGCADGGVGSRVE